MTEYVNTGWKPYACSIIFSSKNYIWHPNKPSSPIQSQSPFKETTALFLLYASFSGDTLCITPLYFMLHSQVTLCASRIFTLGFIPLTFRVEKSRHAVLFLHEIEGNLQSFSGTALSESTPVHEVWSEGGKSNGTVIRGHEIRGAEWTKLRLEGNLILMEITLRLKEVIDTYFKFKEK